MMNKKLFASLVVAATALVGLAGCGNGKEVFYDEQKIIC